MTFREPLTERLTLQTYLLTFHGFPSLTVSRDTLGSSRFVHQLQRTLIKKSLDLFTKLSKDDIPTFKKLYELVGPSFKVRPSHL